MSRSRTLAAALAVALASPLVAQAQSEAQRQTGKTGASALWILANFAYAGMRAQAHPSEGWRILSFLFGLPGTLLSYFVVPEGGERAYGVELPRKRNGDDSAA